MTLKEEFENELVIIGFTGEKQIYTNDFGMIYINWLETKLISLSQYDVVGRSEQFICHSCGTNHSGKNDDQLFEVCNTCFYGI